jgi:hypothetical protein
MDLIGTIEGSLDILWENYEQPANTPRYRVLFASYTSLKGTLPEPAPRHIDGTEALESYLVEKGLKAKEAKKWVKQVQEQKNASIPNVILRLERVGPPL